MKLENSLENIIEYKYSYNEGNEEIHIGYGIDDNYARCTASSIFSFYINNRNKKIFFHIIAANLSNETKKKFKILAKTYNLNLIIYEINIKFFETLPIKDYISIATYFRFLLPLILKDIDVLFYIDADIICIKEASKLFDINLEDNIIGAVPDLYKMNNKRNNVLGLKEHIYVNAGLIMIDIQKWNKYNVSEKAIKLLIKYPDKYLYQDQDVLNELLTKRIKYLNKIFNCIDIYSVKQESIVLLHFANNPKPWNEKWNFNRMYNDFTKNLYKSFENQTPWKDTPLIKTTDKKLLLKIYIKYILYKLVKYI